MTAQLCCCQACYVAKFSARKWLIVITKIKGILLHRTTFSKTADRTATTIADKQDKSAICAKKNKKNRFWVTEQVNLRKLKMITVSVAAMSQKCYLSQRTGLREVGAPLLSCVVSCNAECVSDPVRCKVCFVVH